jgi:hypothetical protein
MTTTTIHTNRLWHGIGGPLVVSDAAMPALLADAKLMAPYFSERLAANKQAGLSGPALSPFHRAADKWDAIHDALSPRYCL